MNPPDDDHALLRRYATQHCEDSFRQLVSRHLGLVYSAALRQTRSTHAAEDLSQSVFIDLSRSATRIRPDIPLTAWLYTVTRRNAIDLIRREASRAAREQLAARDPALSVIPTATTPPHSSSDETAAWSRLSGALDEAMMSLAEKDRTALLLRFFAGKPIREIGDQLHLSEDAAQKRIARALDRLRENLTRRGFIVGSTTLATALSAHAVHIAPAALATSISSTALLTPPIAVSSLATLLAMTAAHKTVIATTLALTLGCALYEAHLLKNKNTELAALRAELAHARTKQAEIEKELAASDATLAKADDVLTSLANGPDASLNAELRAWVQRVHELKAWTARLPQYTIPEMALLTESDWLEAARRASLADQDGARQAMSHVRSLAKDKFIPLLQAAVKAHKNAHNGAVPEKISALTPYLSVPASPAMLARYEVIPESLRNDRKSSRYIVEKDRVDDDYDSAYNIQRNGDGWGSSNHGKLDDQLKNLIRVHQKKSQKLSHEIADEIIESVPQFLTPSNTPRIKARLLELISQTK